ncbi:MAG: SDR family NAD(P)-dependent oxidoreductase [Chloroflexi bacterium]|nr:SDR family NAD(P)-dependent oxidoreductase [Chloroflexota bacterium]
MRVTHVRAAVITGASSGIGRATAIELARRGFSVALAARRAEPLRTLAQQIETSGGTAIVVPTDVTDEAAVEALADRASRELGGFEVWVNNAAVYLAGRFEDVPSDAFRQVIETNLMGYTYGARAALRHFRARGAGTLINNASLGGKLAMPYFSAYTASKFAIYGLSRALREELRGTNIRVCVVLPATIDTPIFQHAGNFDGRQLDVMQPVYDAGRVARAIGRLAEKPRSEIVVGTIAKLLLALARFAPDLAQRIVTREVEGGHFSQTPLPPSAGNLFQPVAEGADVSGGWPQVNAVSGWAAAAAAFIRAKQPAGPTSQHRGKSHQASPAPSPLPSAT